jgi:hypothetical protein
MPGLPANLAGTMPGETVNGWFTIVPELLAHPDKLRLLVGVFDVDTIKVKVATHGQTPVVQLRHVEVVDLGDAELTETVSAILRNLQRARLGDEQLELTYTPGAIAPAAPPAGTPADDD